MKPWHEDDRFWDAFRASLFDQARLSSAAAEVDFLIRAMELKPGNRILDLPCGVGRHSVELARRGLAVTASDRTRAYLDTTEQAARKAGAPLAALREADMRAFGAATVGSQFDAAINIYTSLGFFESQAQDVAVLRNYFQVLRPGGRLAIDIMGKEVLARTLVERGWVEQSDGSLFLRHTTVTKDWSGVTNRWIRVDAQGR